MAVTIKDVAKECKLALSTISKYMNGGNVKAGNKEKIEAAIQKLGYQPNNLAKGLKNSRTYTIGLSVDSLKNQYIGKLVEKIEQLLKAEGYTLYISCHKDTPEGVSRSLQFLEDKQVDGIILVPVGQQADFPKSIYEKKLPLVTMDRSFNAGSFDCITSNSATGMYLGTEYLIQQGHKKIAILSGTKKGCASYLSGKERLNGYLRAMEDYQLDCPSHYILEGDYSFESGYKHMEQLWSSPTPPTAIIISNYNMCLGAITAIHNLGISIPKDLSIVTFDDLEFSLISSPRLTAIRQPADDIARETVNLILQRINGGYSDFPKNIKLPTQFIIRESVEKPQLSMT
ncbi:MAG TPA: LacI family transcriptional regulator [Clostridiales bacterium]|nr:LacI family transcriptional regulator [Clostridiales bacterium]